jgi:hypothetical protein
MGMLLARHRKEQNAKSKKAGSKQLTESARLQEEQTQENGQRESETEGESQTKRKAGRPRKETTT